MKLFRYISGVDERYGAAEDEKDAYDRRREVDHTFHFLPVRIEEVTLEGYEITLKPIKQSKPPNFEKMDRDALKAWLKDNNIEFTPQWGEEKLRELALKSA